jgi:uncharacterized membrane protein
MMIQVSHVDRVQSDIIQINYEEEKTNLIKKLRKTVEENLELSAAVTVKRKEETSSSPHNPLSV